MKTINRIFLVFFFALMTIACNTAPKGEYSRSKIARPYAMPDDVARSSLGFNYSRFELEDDLNTLDEDDEAE